MVVETAVAVTVAAATVVVKTAVVVAEPVVAEPVVRVVVVSSRGAIRPDTTCHRWLATSPHPGTYRSSVKSGTNPHSKRWPLTESTRDEAYEIGHRLCPS